MLNKKREEDRARLDQAVELSQQTAAQVQELTPPPPSHVRNCAWAKGDKATFDKPVIQILVQAGDVLVDLPAGESARLSSDGETELQVTPPMAGISVWATSPANFLVTFEGEA